MYCKMNTKAMAALAVFAMVFAGFGAMAFADDNDADATGKTLKLVFEGTYIDDSDKVISQLGGTASYIAILDEDFEEKITILTKDYYDAMKDACTIKGDTVTFKLDDAGKIVIPTGVDYSVDDVEQGLITFTSYAVSKTDEISGISTVIEFKDVVTKDVTYNLVFEDDAEAAIIIAVAAAVAEVEAEYADYLSPEEVQTAIDKAVADTKALYEDYKSPEEVKKIVKDAVDEAIAEYIATHPAKKDDTFLYVTIVLAAIVIALVGFTVFDKVIKPKMAKKDETQVI